MITLRTSNKIVVTLFMGMLSFISLHCFGGLKPAGSNSKVSFYSLSFTANDGSTVAMESFRGKKVLLVNTASRCGYTPQYEELEKLHKTYGNKVVVIGFPANNFMGQEPGTDSTIAEFCKVNYGVSFLLAAKSSVKGDDQGPVFRWLTDASLNGWNASMPKWNFYKYLIDEQGELIGVFPSSTTPLSTAITEKL